MTSKMEEDEKPEDIISNLPDAIVHLILSFVPTKSMIAASSVSRRWRDFSAEHLAYATNLDFGEEFSKRQTPNQFIENLDGILSVNVSEQIDKFKLMFSPRDEQHKSHAINWIKFAISKEVRELDLDFCTHIQHHFLIQTHVMNREEAFEMPSFLFDCKSLTTVKLSRCISALPEKYAGFGALQTLCLREAHFTDNMLENLLSSCPLLEVLVLKEIGSLREIRILTATRLKRLTVYECYNASVLEISGPNIQSLLISAGHLDSCYLENMSSLKELFIGTRGDEFGGVLYIFMKVLSDLAHVRALTLYLGHLVPSLIKNFRVKFRNLLELQLVNSPLFGLFNTDVYCFFRHCICPSLQKLYIELSTVSEEENFIWEYRKPNVEPVEYLFSKLRLVELRNFRGTGSDKELAVYFLERAPVLGTMLLITPQKSNTSTAKTMVENGAPHFMSEGDETMKWMQRDMVEALHYRPKASPNAEITIKHSNENENLSSLFRWHHVFDLYHK